MFTRAGLLALADIGLHLQPILFTHHRFVADMAKESAWRSSRYHQPLISVMPVHSESRFGI
jgi:hypothetical protein